MRKLLFELYWFGTLVLCFDILLDKLYALIVFSIDVLTVNVYRYTSQFLFVLKPKLLLAYLIALSFEDSEIILTDMTVLCITILCLVKLVQTHYVSYM